MKYLITVGTTSFDTLIKQIDQSRLLFDCDITLQIANGRYIPRNFNYFRFKKDILNVYSEHIIVTHAGAGTAFSLLDKRRQFIAVPNLERQDKHQLELARYLDKNNYSKVFYDFELLDNYLASSAILKEKFNTYNKVNFFKTTEIKTFLGLK